MIRFCRSGLLKAINLFLCALICQSALASIAVNLSPPSIQQGETFRLTLTLDAMQNHGVPDVVPLLKDFDIVGTERNISYTVINGQARAISQWSIILKPKAVGTLIIPPIHIGQEQSLPSQVVVQKNTSISNTTSFKEPKDASLFLASVSNKKPFVHQQIIYTVRLLTQQRLLDAQYHPPQVEDALLLPLGDGRHYQTQFQGQSYEVEEQQYAVFPQKSGPLTISPPSLDAMAFGDFGPTRIHLAAKPLQLTVASLPPNQSIKNWLPARAMTLNESYDNTSTVFSEGDTLVRTITLKTQDLVAQLLPTLTFNHTASYHVYQEKPTTENQIDNGDLWGSSQIQLTYLLAQPGQIVLPAIHIPWFNTVTNQPEIATLPERTLTVNIRPGSSQTNLQSSSLTRPASPPLAPSLQKQPYQTGVFWGLAWFASLTCLGWLFWRQHQRKQTSSTADTDKMLSLKKACKANDPYQARLALLHWATTQWPGHSILNLNDIPVDHPAFKTELDRLSQALYASQQKIAWHGDALWQCVDALKTKRPSRKKSNIKLPPMNPSNP